MALLGALLVRAAAAAGRAGNWCPGLIISLVRRGTSPGTTGRHRNDYECAFWT